MLIAISPRTKHRATLIVLQDGELRISKSFIQLMLIVANGEPPSYRWLCSGAIAGRGRNLNHGHSRTAVSRTAHPYKAQIGGNKTFRPASHSLVLNNTSKSTSSDKPASSSKIAPQPIGNGSNAYGNNEERWVNSTNLPSAVSFSRTKTEELPLIVSFFPLSLD
jgi:hypothetical protein